MTFDFDQLPREDAAVIQQHSRSFSWAARFLPPDLRRDVEKLYAWCRWCDNAVDEAPNAEQARQRLDRLRADVQLIYSGHPPRHRASQWLAELVARYQIPSQLPLDLLNGMETDIAQPRLATPDDLLLYCYQAAGTVGLMMCRILGVTDPSALAKAKSMGMAMQLTNIARDVDQDWRIGRRYLPEVWLSLIPGQDSSPTDQQLRPALENVLDLAEEFYAQGFQGLALLPHKVRLAIRLAGTIYRDIGNQIRLRKYSVMNTRVFVPWHRKFCLFAGCLFDECWVAWQSQSRPMTGPLNRVLGLASDFVSSPFSREPVVKSETLYLFYLGLSLTLTMAMTLFVLVGINPKASTYQSLPWLYSAICGLLALTTGWLARRYHAPSTANAIKLDSR